MTTGESEAEFKGNLDSEYAVRDVVQLVSGLADRTVHIWNVTPGTSGVSSDLPDGVLLQDGIYVHHHPRGIQGHISSPLIQTGIPPLHFDSPWIVHMGSGLRCWLPPHYRNIETTASHNTLFCIAFSSGLVLAVRFCSDPPNAVPT